MSGRNCNTCQHLEWIAADEDCDSGFDCNKRHEAMYNAGRENELLNNLDRDAYRARYKRCFEPKEPA